MSLRAVPWSTRARWLVAWWVLSVLVLVWLAVIFLIPSDVQFQWQDNLRLIPVMTAGWLLPGFAFGGWKALLVAAKRSDVRTGTDRALMIVFAIWSIGWPALWMTTLAAQVV